MKLKLLLFLCCLSFVGLNAQTTETLIQNYLERTHESLGVTLEDVQNIKIVSDYETQKTGLQHVVVQQTVNEIPVFNAFATVTIKDSSVIFVGNSLIANINSLTNTSAPSFNTEASISKAAQGLEINVPSGLEIIGSIDGGVLFNSGSISQEDIPVKLVYQPTANNDLRLAYEVTILTVKGDHWWNVRVDAQTGEVISKNDWIVSCNFESDAKTSNTPISHKAHNHTKAFGYAENTMMVDGSQYEVFPLLIESPNHGASQIVSEPAAANASPFGWHDINGVAGPEYTITRGNNVWAQDDKDADDAPNGYSPDGGATLDFSGYNTNTDLNPLATTDFAITNLFFWNNLMHDIWYQYGFDEASGNFQENNYGNGGSGSDYVNADAQDGFSLNNANFGTPPDGGNPRMQMFLWSATGPVGAPLTINNPSSIAGAYEATEPLYFGSGLSDTPIISDIVFTTDMTSTETDNFGNPLETSNTDANDGCGVITNVAEVNGNIAIIRRGTCPFVSKVKNAQDAGAIAVIIVNNVANDPLVNMAGTDNTINIPSVFISKENGDPIFTQLQTSNAVDGQLLSQPSQRIDGDFDNGVVAHEYGHGISNRLTGGPSAASCLGNPEQMGEGWSDFFGLMLTLKPGDQPEDIRGIGTYVTGQEIDGVGIRNAPYSTSFAINDFTYADTNNEAQVSVPHGVGFVWATMLWDMTWALIDEYGYDADLYNGTGGNNIAMQLVIDGLKMQSCNPGFIDGRDAILAADMAVNGGANQCLIYTAFAQRGLGFSAEQGSNFSRTDQVEAFDMPPTNVLDCSNLSVAENTLSQFKVYPNPATNVINISLNKTLANDVNVSLTDLQGRQVLKTKIGTASTTSIDVSSISNGVYILSLESNNKTYSQKVIIE